MNIVQIETNLQKLIVTFNKQSFIYELLLAYGLPKASITRLKKGNLNLAKVVGEVSWKKKLFFREEQKEDLHLTISKIAKDLKHNERFVIVTDYKTILAVDTKTDDKLDIELNDLPKYYDFFLPWAGMEKAHHANENPADVKAAEKMAKLFDEIKKNNPDNSADFIHGLNVFLSRLLFCFFAEDTHIFEVSQFTNAIDSHTQADGSDLNTYLDTLFTVLNTPENERENLPEYLKAFPFVNGGLFKDNIATPKFSRSSRSAILNSGDQDWSAINPDIFGSMFQAVISFDQRGSLGQHYTSVPNIMKVIEPLFLNDLYEEFDTSTSSAPNLKQKKLNALLNRIHNFKIFDPACGSGNFLIIAYKELRILEMKIFKAIGGLPLSGIKLSQFYGIEIDDFAGEIAKLALWLAEHQMNVEFFKEFGRTNKTLPLKEAGKIVRGNATRLDWEEVCPKDNSVSTEKMGTEWSRSGSEIYILGNPPYLGARMQNKVQKADMKFVFTNLKGFNNLDYISCWFKKGSDFIINSNSKYAFVTTNSISQGEQVALLWPTLLKDSLEIQFVHQSFKWTNNAKGNAGVTVAIIGIGNELLKNKIILKDRLSHSVKNINPYLVSGSNSFIQKRNKPVSFLPMMPKGNMPYDKGFLLFNKKEKEELLFSYPSSKKFIRNLIGSKEFINGIERYCLWIHNSDLDEALKIKPILDRTNSVKEIRLQSSDKGAHKLANRPHQFREINETSTQSLVIPSVSSERREYIPIGYVGSDTIITNLAFVIYNSKPHNLGIITSRMHMTWMRAVAGRLKSDYRYSSTLVYNTFPFPPISTQRKNEITQATFRILEEREKHPEKTLAQLYDPDKMPEGLREAHRQNDEIIEKCYRSTPFKSDEERLEYLFKLYEKMIAEEKEQGTLFAKEKKTRKKR
jgi:type I restriction-modification system DNA methylase subunit